MDVAGLADAEILRREEGGDGDADRGQPNQAVEGSASVVAMAMTMPAMPKRLPDCALTGDDRPRSAMMKQTEAMR